MNRHPCLGMAASLALWLVLPSGAGTASPALSAGEVVVASARPATVSRPAPHPEDVYICLPAGPDGVAECWRP